MLAKVDICFFRNAKSFSFFSFVLFCVFQTELIFAKFTIPYKNTTITQLTCKQVKLNNTVSFNLVNVYIVTQRNTIVSTIGFTNVVY